MCPMRIFIALFSLLLVGWSLLSLMRSGEEGRPVRKAAQRQQSAWRFVASLFTGEYVYHFFNRGEDVASPQTSSETVAEEPGATAAG
jgi:hypothetical protein